MPPPAASSAVAVPSRDIPFSVRLGGVRVLRYGVLLLPTLLTFLADLSRRADRILGFEGNLLQSYLAAALESSVLWATLLFAASGRKGFWRSFAAGAFVISFTLVSGGQAYFHQQYNAYLNIDVSLFASNLMDSVINQLFADFGNYMTAKLPWLVVSLALVALARLTLRPSPRLGLGAGLLAPVFLGASFYIPTQHRHTQASLPDVLYLQAVGGLISTQLGFTDQSNQLRPKARHSLPVPPLKPDVSAPRNVLLLLLESVREDATCVDYSPDCRRTKYSNELTPNRIGLHQMRSHDSCTAISLSVLWSGMAPTQDRETLHTWPLLFDYARAAGWDTAYWTSQNEMFGNARLWVKNLGVNHFVSATELDPTCDLDMGAPERKLAQYIETAFDDLEEPFFATVQFSNVHYPYYLETDGPQPFQPWTVSKAPEDNSHFFNFYLNAVHQEDQHVASIIRKVRSTEKGKRTVIVYTSDHGEAFREHGQMGHTFSILEEEVHVPAWIDAPAGTLTPQQTENLRQKRDVPAFHADLTATMLDVMGLWDAPEIAPFKEKMVGESLLRPKPNERPQPLTNCAGVWSCAFENWGYMQGGMKLEARSWDSEWHCYDVLRDPLEQVNLGAEACGDLKERALSTFGRLPGKQPE